MFSWLRAAPPPLSRDAPPPATKRTTRQRTGGARARAADREASRSPEPRDVAKPRSAWIRSPLRRVVPAAGRRRSGEEGGGGHGPARI